MAVGAAGRCAANPRTRSVPYDRVGRPAPRTGQTGRSEPGRASSSVRAGHPAGYRAGCPALTAPGQDVFCSSQAFGVKEELTKTTQPPL